MKSRTAGLAAGTLTVLALGATPVLAAPATVTLRVEGTSRTLYEASVTTDVRRFRFTGESADYVCDGTDGNGGPSDTPVPTRGAALAEAAERAPLAIRGTFSTSLGSPSLTEVAGENVDYDAVTQRFLAEYKNGEFSSFGSCGDPIQTGDDVLFAYGTGAEQLLSLSGPESAEPGDTVELTVTDAATKTPVAGAAVGTSVSDAAGKVRVVVPTGGPGEFKASKAGAIRSNRVEVTVRDRRRPVGRVLDIAEGERFARRRAPRRLRISATDPGGIAQVKLRLTRRAGVCSSFSRRQERFRRTRCGRGSFFKASDTGDFTYLLPERLGRGRYVLDVVAIDRAANRDRLARGRSRVVFFVR